MAQNNPDLDNLEMPALSTLANTANMTQLPHLIEHLATVVDEYCNQAIEDRTAVSLFPARVSMDVFNVAVNRYIHLVNDGLTLLFENVRGIRNNLSTIPSSQLYLIFWNNIDAMAQTEIHHAQVNHLNLVTRDAVLDSINTPVQNNPPQDNDGDTVMSDDTIDP